MKELVISNDHSSYIVIREDQWEEIQKAEREGRCHQFTGRIAGLCYEGEPVWIRCATGKPGERTWSIQDHLEVCDGEPESIWL